MTPSTTLNALAIEGGQPSRELPLSPWPYFEADEIEAAATVCGRGKSIIGLVKRGDFSKRNSPPLPAAGMGWR